MDKTLVNTIESIFEDYRKCIGDDNNCFGRFLVSLYRLASGAPSQEVLDAIDLPIDSFQTILSTTQLETLKGNYRSTVQYLFSKRHFLEGLQICSSQQGNTNATHNKTRAKFFEELFRDAHIDDPFSNEAIGNSDVLYKISAHTIQAPDIPNKDAVKAAINNTLNQWNGLFIIGAGLNHFIDCTPDRPIYGIELNPRLWGFGQIYLDSQNFNNVYIYKRAKEIPCHININCILLLSADKVYRDCLKKDLKQYPELVAVLPKTACFTDGYLGLRRYLLTTHLLASVITAHEGQSGLSIFYAYNSFKIKQKSTKRHPLRFVKSVIHFFFPRKPNMGLFLLTSFFGIGFLLTLIFNILYGFKFASQLVALINFGGLLLVTLLAARFSSTKEKTKLIRFTTISDFRDACLCDWEFVTKHFLRNIDPEKEVQTQRLLDIPNREKETTFSSRVVPSNSIQNFDFRSYVDFNGGKTDILSNLVNIIEPSHKTEIETTNPVLHIVSGHPLSANYLSCELREKDLNPSDFPGRYNIPGGTYLWHYYFNNLRVGHISFDATLSNVSLKRSHTLLFTPKSESIDIQFLLRALTSDYIQEQLLWIGPIPTINDILMISIPVPSLEQQNRELLADAFARLEKEHSEFVDMVTDHKHNVGNLLKFLYYDFDILKYMIESSGQLALNDVVDPKKGSTVQDFFNAIAGYKSEIGDEMEHFWIATHDDTKAIQLRAFIDTLLSKQVAHPYAIDLDVPNDTVVYCSTRALSTIIRNVFINAEKHGFSDKQRNNYTIRITQLNISAEGIDYARLIIDNNGEPLPEDINESSIFNRGVGTGNSEHVGCSTIKDLCDEFNVKVHIEKRDDPHGFNVAYIFDFPINN